MEDTKTFDTTNENTFNVTTAGNPNSNRVQGYSIFDINSINQYQFMDEAFNGTAGFRDGSYLVAFSRESAYLDRRKISYYQNFVKPIFRAMVEPVFSPGAIRVVKDSNGVEITEGLFPSFLQDVDAAGTTIHDFVHSAINICRRHGVVFIVMDNYPVLPGTESEAIANRAYPYVYIKTAMDVESYETDKWGNITEITLYDGCVNYAGEKTEAYRRWTASGSEQLIEVKGKYKVITSEPHNFGVVPVIPIFSIVPEDKKNLLPDPPGYDMAKSNWTHYNISSEKRNLERQLTFSMMYAQGLPEQDLVAGANTYINLPMGATIVPGFATPPMDTMRYLGESMEAAWRNIYDQAERLGVIGVQTAESGIAKSFDFFGHESTLQRTAYIATELELKISKMFKLITNSDFDYIVKYKSDYAPLGIDREVDRIIKIMNVPGLNTRLLGKLQEKLARLSLSDENKAEVEEIVKAITGGEDAGEEMQS